MNNFDQSSTGVNIELFIHRDSELGRYRFEDFVGGGEYHEVTQLRNRRGDLDHLVIFDKGEEFESHYTEEMLDQMEVFELEETMDLFGYSRRGEDPEAEDYVHYLKDELRSVNKLQYRKKMHEERSWRDLDYDFVSNGYSQGDSLSIWISDRAKEQNPWLTQEYFDNLLWDAPVSGLLVVNGEDIYLDEHIEDEYNFDKGKMIGSLRELDLPEEVYEFLYKNVPDSPDYV